MPAKISAMPAKWYQRGYSRRNIAESPTPNRRHQVHERPAAARAQAPDRVAPAGVGEQHRADRRSRAAPRTGVGVEVRAWIEGEVPREPRQQKIRPHDAQRDQVGRRGERVAAHAQQNGVRGKQQHRQQAQQVAAVECQRSQRGWVAAQRDRQHAGKRDRHAGPLQRADPLAERRARHQQDEDRRHRREQRPVGRRGVVQAEPLQRQVQSPAGDRERGHDRPVAPAVGAQAVAQFAPAERRQQQDHDDQPADGDEAGRNVVAHGAADDPVARPQQHREVSRMK